MHFGLLRALSRAQVRLLATDWQPVVVLIAMPLLLILFLRPAYRAELHAEGYATANGAEQVVPGVAVLFSFLFVSFIGFEFFREHGNHTWERLQAAGASRAELLAGKALPFVGFGLLQYGVLFAAAALLFRLRVNGSVVALALVCIALVMCVTALGLALVAVCRTYQQLNAAGNLGALVLAGMGGAISPLPTLPETVRAVSHATPTYWAMRAFRSTILEGAGISGVLGPVAALVAFTLAFGALAARFMRLEDEKVL
jgi:ABC-2 type transport system permease protein